MSYAGISPTSPAEKFLIERLSAGSPAQLGPFGNKSNPRPKVRAELLRDLFVSIPSTAPGVWRFEIQGARICGQLDLADHELKQALSFRRCAFDMPVDLRGARLSRFSAPGSLLNGLMAEGLECRGNVELSDGFRSESEVDLLGARIGGLLDCKGGEFRGTEVALRCDSSVIAMSVLLRAGFRARGTVSFPGAQIGGTLDCSAGVFEGDPALFADGMRVALGVYFRGLQSHGLVKLIGAQIMGQFDLLQARLLNEGGMSLVAERLQVHGDMRAEDVVAQGTVRLSHSRIDEQLTLTGNFSSSVAFDGSGESLDSSMAIDLEGATVGGDLFLLPNVTGPRPCGLDLRALTIRTLVHDTRQYPEILRLEDFQFRDIVCMAHLDVDPSSPTEVQHRLAWLRHAHAFTPGAYDQLVASYGRRGEERAARRVQIAKQAHRQKILGLAGRIWNTFLRYTVGYGYSPARAAVWLLILFAVGVVIFQEGYDRHQIFPRVPGSTDSFHAWSYSLDLLLPVLNLRQRDAWMTNGATYVLFIFFQLAGWLIAAAIVAGIGRLLRRE